jgi:hypothetical protein
LSEREWRAQRRVGKKVVGSGCEGPRSERGSGWRVKMGECWYCKGGIGLMRSRWVDIQDEAIVLTNGTFVMR